MTACPAKQSAFFGRMVKLIRPMAGRLSVDEDFILALCANEHGWEDSHNDRLHNMFGVTHAGGNNLAFVSDQAACDSWESHYGGIVRGSSSMTEFVRRLRTIPYNSATTGYDQKLIDVYKAVLKYKSACGFAPK